jgi:hypothetical protein
VIKGDRERIEEDNPDLFRGTEIANLMERDLSAENVRRAKSKHALPTVGRTFLKRNYVRF